MRLGLMLLWRALAIVPCAFASGGFAEDWSRFRGPNGSGISQDKGFPAQLDPAKDLAWRTAVRSGKSSPVLTERHVFLTAFENGRLFTQCVDRKSGRLLWERGAARPRAESGNVRNEPAAMTPVTDGENVYAFFADLGLVSYDAAGSVRWLTPLGPFTNSMGLAASPILAGDSVIVFADGNDDSYIAAFDRRTGEVRWRCRRDEKDGERGLVPAGPDAIAEGVGQAKGLGDADAVGVGKRWRRTFGGARTRHQARD